MFRIFENTLQDWKKTGMQKPLMVIGVRQIGKTYTIDKFGKENFEDYLYFNLKIQLMKQKYWNNLNYILEEK